MKTNSKLKSPLLRRAVLLGLPLLAAAGQASAYDVYLQAGTNTIPNPNGAALIPVWGYSSCNADFTTCGAVQVPGPAITIPAGTTDDDLVVHLKNMLTVPTSLIIDGLPLPTDASGGALAPTRYVADATDNPANRFTGRVRSLTGEAAPGATQVYLWTDVKPGTYLYRSGTHMQVQDQMGLYGAVNHDFVASQAYDNANTAYTASATLVYSEIDPIIHNAVAANKFGPFLDGGVDQCTLPVSAPRTVPADWVCSTVNYKPAFVLINGKPYNPASPDDTRISGIGSAGQTTLLRLLNASLQTRVPALHGGADLKLIAEDGKPYAHPKTQYTAFLPSMKTLDALLVTQNQSNLTLLDSTAPNDALAFLSVGTGAQPSFNLTGCLAAPQPLGTALGGSFTCALDALDSTGGTAVTYSLVSGPTGLTLSGNTVSWNPAAPAGKNIPVVIKAADAATPANARNASFAIDVTGPIPTADADSYNATKGQVLSVNAVDGVLNGDVSDPTGHTLTASLVTAPLATDGTLTLNADGSFVFTAKTTAGASASFTYKAVDATNASESVPATVTINIAAPAGPIATADEYTVPASKSFAAPQTTPVVITGILANDTIATPASTKAYKVANPANGSVLVNLNGSITYTPNANFAGDDSFTYKLNDGVTDSAPATVTIHVVNTAPVANNDGSATDPLLTLFNRTLTVSALANDTDAQGNIDPTSVTIIDQPPISGTTRVGNVVVNPNGTVTFTPRRNFVGPTSFTYQVKDKVGLASNTATVSLYVGGKPVADSYLATVTQRTAGNVQVAAPGVLANDLQTSGWTPTYVSGSLRRNGALPSTLSTATNFAIRCSGTGTTSTGICTTGAFRLNLPTSTTASNRTGVYTFDYRLVRNGVQSAPVTVTVTVP